MRVDGFYCEGCSTGIATSGTSVNRGVVTRNIHGVDLLFGQGEHVVAQSPIEGRGGTAAVLVETMTAYAPAGCSLRLENVVVGGTLAKAGSANLVHVTGASNRLTLDHSTLCGLSIKVEKGATLLMHDSAVTGGVLTTNSK